MKKAILYGITLGFLAFGHAQKTDFDQKSLEEKFVSAKSDSISFGNILKSHKGKTVLIKVWASWCKDCIVDLPNVEALEKANKQLVVLALSLDKTVESWRAGIEKYKVSGLHYFIEKGWKKSNFCSGIDLDWIPRYMLVDAKGRIVVYRAVKANEDDIKNALSKR